MKRFSGWRLATAIRQQAPPQTQKPDRQQRQRQTHGREIEEWNGPPSVSWRTVEISRLGDAPISVIVPPINEPNDSGIR